MSHYEKTVQVKAALNQVSPSFCLAKWLQVSLHLPTGRTHSCYHPPSHKIPLAELQANPSALHNTTFKKARRKEMLAGVRPEECSYCWTVEDMPGDLLSDRHYRSAESWAFDDMERIQALPWDADVKPRYLEVNFNQACQFKCSYCSPQLSSAWMAEVRQLGFVLTTRGYNRISWLEKNDLMPFEAVEKNPYVDAFWRWWPDVYSHLRVFRMTGGEPLMDPNTTRVLQYAIENPHPHLTLSLTSNLCPTEKQFQNFMTLVTELLQKKSIERFFLFASIDSVGRQAEYIRSGLNYAKFNQNVHRYLALPNVDICFILTFNCLSAPGFRAYLEWILELRARYSQKTQRILFDTPFLHHPEFMSLQILNPEWRAHLKETVDWAESVFRERPEALDGFTKMEIDKLHRLLNWVESPVEEFELKNRRADFYFYFSDLDRRRGTQFLETFPEMENFWNFCEQESQSFHRARV